MSGAAVSGFMKEFGLLDSEEHRRRDSRNVPGKGIWACEWRHRRLSSARLPLHVVMKLNSDNCNNCIQCTPAMWGSHSGYNFAKQSIWWMNLLHLCANNWKWVSAYMLWWPCCAPVWSCWSSELLTPRTLPLLAVQMSSALQTKSTSQSVAFGFDPITAYSLSRWPANIFLRGSLQCLSVRIFYTAHLNEDEEWDWSCGNR